MAQFLNDLGFDVYGNIKIQAKKFFFGQEWKKARNEEFYALSMLDTIVFTYGATEGKLKVT